MTQSIFGPTRLETLAQIRKEQQERDAQAATMTPQGAIFSLAYGSGAGLGGGIGGAFGLEQQKDPRLAAIDARDKAVKAAATKHGYGSPEFYDELAKQLYKAEQYDLAGQAQEAAMGMRTQQADINSKQYKKRERKFLVDGKPMVVDEVSTDGGKTWSAVGDQVPLWKPSESPEKTAVNIYDKAGNPLGLSYDGGRTFASGKPVPSDALIGPPAKHTLDGGLDDSFAFEGNGMEAQANRIVAHGNDILGRGGRLTPEQQTRYELAKRFLLQSRVTGSQTTGFTEIKASPLPGIAMPEQPPLPSPQGAPAPQGRQDARVEQITAPKLGAGEQSRIREQLLGIREARKKMQRMQEIMKAGGEDVLGLRGRAYMTWNDAAPTVGAAPVPQGDLAQEFNTLANELRGFLRVPITGPGNTALPEWKIIDETIKAKDLITSTSSVNTAFRSLGNTLDSLESRLKSYGADIEPNETSGTKGRYNIKTLDNGIQTWETDTHYYRKLPNGRTQMKAK